SYPGGWRPPSLRSGMCSVGSRPASSTHRPTRQDWYAVTAHARRIALGPCASIIVLSLMLLAATNAVANGDGHLFYYGHIIDVNPGSRVITVRGTRRWPAPAGPAGEVVARLRPGQSGPQLRPVYPPGADPVRILPGVRRRDPASHRLLGHVDRRAAAS